MSLFFVDIYNHRQRLKSRENFEGILTQSLRFYKTAAQNYAIALFMFSHNIVSSMRWGADQFIVLTVSTPSSLNLGLMNKWMMLNILEKMNLPVIVLSVHVKYDPKTLSTDYRNVPFLWWKSTLVVLMCTKIKIIYGLLIQVFKINYPYFYRENFQL